MSDIASRKAARSAEIKAALAAVRRSQETSEESIRQATKDPILERAILGACLLDPDVMEIAAGAIATDDFTHPAHVETWYAMRKLWEEGIAVDITTASSQMADAGMLTPNGGMEALQAYTTGVTPIGFDIDSYVKVLRQKTVARQLVELGMRMGSMVRGNSSSLIERVEAAIMGISKRADNDTSDLNFEESIAELSGGMQEFLGKTSPPILLTPHRELNQKLRPMREGELIIIGGRPGSGKSIIGVEIAFCNALPEPWVLERIKKPARTIYVSLEMSKDTIWSRIVCDVLGIPNYDLQDGNVNSTQAAAIEALRVQLNTAPLTVTTKARTVAKLRSMILRRNAASESPVRLVVIDHIQLMRGRLKGYVNKTIELTEISGDLKELSMSLKCTIIALSQLSRAGTQREDKRPVISDFRESGSLEQDGDTAAIIHRPELLDTDNPSLRNKVEFYVLKQRSGQTGVAKLAFDGQYYRLRDPEQSATQ